MKRGDRTDPWTVRQEVIHKGTPHARDRWVLYLHKSRFGKAKKLYFGTKKDATAHAKRELEELLAHGQKATKLTDIERASAVKAINLLRDRGCSSSLEEIANYFIKHSPREGDASVRDVVLQFLEQRGVSQRELDQPGKHRNKDARQRDYKDHSLRHRTSLTSRLRPFVEKWGDKPIRLVASEPESFVAWMRDELPQNVRRKWSKAPIKELSSTTVDNTRRTIHSVFNFAISRNFCAGNPAKRWDELKRKIKKENKSYKPPILTPNELIKLLKAAQKTDKRTLAGLVTAAFSGVRTDEVCLLTWGMFKKDRIHLPAKVTKTRDEAEVGILPTLATWLSHIEKGKSDEFVVPRDFAKRRLKLCRKIKLVWPKNALRHSFGSYRYAQTQRIEQTAFEMRHEDIQTFRRHYLNRGITQQMAKAYFNILP